MKLGIGIVGFTSPDGKKMIEEVWKSIQENPRSSLWLIKPAVDYDRDALRKILTAARFEKDIEKVLAQLKELYEPLVKFSLAAVIPRELLCDGHQDELDIGLARYWFEASVKLLHRHQNQK